MEANEIAALVLLGIAVVFNIVSLAIPDWIVILTLKIGLFKICLSGLCVSYSPTVYLYASLSTLRGTAGGLILAVLLNGIAVILTALFVFTRDKRQPSILTAAMVLSIIGGIMTAMCFLTWFIQACIWQYIPALGAAVWLCLVAPVFCFVHAGLVSGMRKRLLQQVRQIAIIHQPQSQMVVMSQQSGYPPRQQPGYPPRQQPGAPPSYSGGYPGPPAAPSSNPPAAPGAPELYPNKYDRN